MLQAQAEQFELYNGDCMQFLKNQKDNAFDAIITDPPFSKRTHQGYARLTREDGYLTGKLEFGYLTKWRARQLAREFDRTSKNWIVWMTDHVLMPFIMRELQNCGRYVFPPVGYFDPERNVRFSGDGPTGLACFIVVARAKNKNCAKWASLTGLYQKQSQWGKSLMVGGKPPGLLRQIVRDYTKFGEHVCDPFLGLGTTGMAAVAAGRKFSGCEIDARRFARAKKNIEAEAVKVRSGLFDASHQGASEKRAARKEARLF